MHSLEEKLIYFSQLITGNFGFAANFTARQFLCVDELGQCWGYQMNFKLYHS